MGKIETSSLPWIIQALLHSSGREKLVSLKDLIMTGDVISHAVFNSGELQNGLFSLFEFGIIEIVNEKYKLTEKGNNLFESAIGEELSISKEYSIINRIIKRIDMPNIDAQMSYNDKLNPIIFSKIGFEQIVKEYIQEANNVVDKLINSNK